MKRIVNALSFLIIVFISWQVFAESSVSVAHTIAKTAQEKKLAKEIDDNLSLLLSSIKNAKVTAAKSAKTDSCNEDPKCVAQVVTKNESSDFV
ncbi:hypothetical protein IKP13_08035, partial [bacterium]|nr:hypothetical protein [bacterium]